MADAVAAPTLPGNFEVAPIPFGNLIPWAIFFALLGALALFFVTTYPVTLALPAGTELHEWFHDGRHLLGFPCH